MNIQILNRQMHCTCRDLFSAQVQRHETDEDGDLKEKIDENCERCVQREDLHGWHVRNSACNYSTSTRTIIFFFSSRRCELLE